MSAPRVMRTGALVMVSLMSSDACDMVWLDARRPGQVTMARAYGSGPMTWQEAHQLGTVLTGMAQLAGIETRTDDFAVMVDQLTGWDALMPQVAGHMEAARAELEAQP